MKKFENPSLQVMKFDVMDVITVSGGNVNNCPEDYSLPEEEA